LNAKVKLKYFPSRHLRWKSIRKLKNYLIVIGHRGPRQRKILNKIPHPIKRELRGVPVENIFMFDGYWEKVSLKPFIRNNIGREQGGP